MKINNEFFGVLQEQNILKTTKTKPIVKAIQNRNPVSFYYSGPRKPKDKSVKAGKRFKAEVVALGLSKKGNLIVRAFVQPPSTSKKGYNEHGWRTFMVSRMSAVEVVKNEIFNTKRPGYKDGEESKSGPMQVTYVTSDWGKKEKIIKPEKPEKAIDPVIPGKPTSDIKPEKPEKAIDPVIPGKPTSDIKPETPTELPQIKTPEKPKPIEKSEPENKEIKPTELPQIKTPEKPKPIEKDKEDNNLKEEIKRMKSLILY